MGYDHDARLDPAESYDYDQLIFSEKCAKIWSLTASVLFWLGSILLTVLVWHEQVPDYQVYREQVPVESDVVLYAVSFTLLTLHVLPEIVLDCHVPRRPFAHARYGRLFRTSQNFGLDLVYLNHFQSVLFLLATVLQAAAVYLVLNANAAAAARADAASYYAIDDANAVDDGGANNDDGAAAADDDTSNVLSEEELLVEAYYGYLNLISSGLYVLSASLALVCRGCCWLCFRSCGEAFDQMGNAIYVMSSVLLMFAALTLYDDEGNAIGNELQDVSFLLWSFVGALYVMADLIRFCERSIKLDRAPLKDVATLSTEDEDDGRRAHSRRRGGSSSSRGRYRSRSRGKQSSSSGLWPIRSIASPPTMDSSNGGSGGRWSFESNHHNVSSDYEDEARDLRYANTTSTGASPTAPESDDDVEPASETDDYGEETVDDHNISTDTSISLEEGARRAMVEQIRNDVSHSKSWTIGRRSTATTPTPAALEQKLIAPPSVSAANKKMTTTTTETKTHLLPVDSYKVKIALKAPEGEHEDEKPRMARNSTPTHDRIEASRKALTGAVEASSKTWRMLQDKTRPVTPTQERPPMMERMRSTTPTPEVTRSSSFLFGNASPRMDTAAAPTTRPTGMVSSPTALGTPPDEVDAPSPFPRSATALPQEDFEMKVRSHPNEAEERRPPTPEGCESSSKIPSPTVLTKTPAAFTTATKLLDLSRASSEASKSWTHFGFAETDGFPFVKPTSAEMRDLQHVAADEALSSQNMASAAGATATSPPSSSVASPRITLVPVNLDDQNDTHDMDDDNGDDQVILSPASRRAEKRLQARRRIFGSLRKATLGVGGTSSGSPATTDAASPKSDSNSPGELLEYKHTAPSRNDVTAAMNFLQGRFGKAKNSLTAKKHSAHKSLSPAPSNDGGYSSDAPFGDTTLQWPSSTRRSSRDYEDLSKQGSI